MNLRDEILKEHSKGQTIKIVKYVGDDQKRFDELISLFLGNEYRVTQRAAWAVSYCVDAHPQLVEKHLKKMILNLRQPVHVAVTRNTLRFLQNIDIPKKLSGITAEICFNLLSDPKETVAVRVFAMSVLGNLCKDYPDMKNELKLLIEEQLRYSTVGVKARARRVLKQIDKYN